MIPHLTARGKWVLTSTLLFVVVGVIASSPPLVAMGGLLLAVLLALHVAFYPVAIMLRRKKVELSWWVAPSDTSGGALTAERPFTLHLAYRNHGSRRLRILGSRIFASSALDIDAPPIASVGSGVQVESTTRGVAKCAGFWHFHGSALRFGDSLGLFEIEAYFPNPIAVKVFPVGFVFRAPLPRISGSVAHDKVGLRQVRRRGLAGELREVREHTSGDSFRYIAWKATARKQRLMVRDLETEIISTRLILVDIGADMRQGPVGKTALDWALKTAAAISHDAMQNGDRLGAVGFDSRPVFEVPIAAANQVYLQLADRLLESRCVVDEDLTDVTNGELVAQVARYLAHQEAIDVRVPAAPAIDSAKWNSIVAGPDGQLYDVAITAKIIDRLLDGGKIRDKRGMLRNMYTNVRDGDPLLIPLRRFSRLRGIELPYRQHWEQGARSRGFAAALDTLEQKVDVVYLLSDLAGFDEDEATLRKALANLRRRGAKLFVISPTLASRLPATPDKDDRLRNLLLADWSQQRKHSRQLMKSLGATFVDQRSGATSMAKRVAA